MEFKKNGAFANIDTFTFGGWLWNCHDRLPSAVKGSTGTLSSSIQRAIWSCARNTVAILEAGTGVPLSTNAQDRPMKWRKFGPIAGISCIHAATEFEPPSSMSIPGLVNLNCLGKFR